MKRVLAKTSLMTITLSLFVTLFAIPSIAAKPVSCSALIEFSAHQRSWGEIKQLRFMSWNVAGIYGVRGKFMRISPIDLIPVYDKPARMKTDEQIAETLEIMNSINPDVAILVEVESLRALHTLGNNLDSHYKPFLLEGNDARGIDIGFLVKSDLPIQTEIISNKSHIWKDPVSGRKFPLFSRDVPVTLLRRDNEQKPFAMVFGVHFISQRSWRADDPNNNRMREAQMDVTAELINDYRELYGKEIPIILGGDFNTSVVSGPELKSLRAFLKSAFDLAQKTIPMAARITQTFHEPLTENDAPLLSEHEIAEIETVRTTMEQLDDIRLLGVLPKHVVSASIFRYRDENGNVLPFALNRDERLLQPSDHLPVVIDISREAFD